jgi:hypothetical protein
MKRLLVLMVFGMLLGGLNGCRICECWREAWCSRFRPQQQATVVVTEPCVVTESCCSPCSTPCISPCTTSPMIVPGPAPAR